MEPWSEVLLGVFACLNLVSPDHWTVTEYRKTGYTLCKAIKIQRYDENTTVIPRKCTRHKQVKSELTLSTKLRSEIIWHRFFAVPAFIRRFRSCIAVRKLFLQTSPNFSSRFHDSLCVWQSPDILGEIHKIQNAPTN